MDAVSDEKSHNFPLLSPTFCHIDGDVERCGLVKVVSWLRLTFSTIAPTCDASDLSLESVPGWLVGYARAEPPNTSSPQSVAGPRTSAVAGASRPLGLRLPGRLGGGAVGREPIR